MGAIAPFALFFALFALATTGRPQSERRTACCERRGPGRERSGSGAAQHRTGPAQHRTGPADQD
jgi:hypothetical protein